MQNTGGRIGAPTGAGIGNWQLTTHNSQLLDHRLRSVVSSEGKAKYKI